MTQELRVGEIYTSVQGEGPRTGLPTQFIRFAGCNMRCPGWPCDTQHAIQPELYRNDPKMSAEELLDAIPDWPMSLCLTGGEPFVQPGGALQEFCERAIRKGYHIECFTNGSFEFPVWAMQTMSFMMDWKLRGSGEAETQVKVRYENANRLRRHDGIKFVVTGKQDVNEAVMVYRQLVLDQPDSVQAQFWVAPAWDVIEPADLVEYILERELDWRLNIQTHKYIWDPEERRV